MKDQKDREEMALLLLVADIRKAVGDPEGKLMQDALVARCEKMHEALRVISVWTSCDHGSSEPRSKAMRDIEKIAKEAIS